MRGRVSVQRDHMNSNLVNGIKTIRPNPTKRGKKRGFESLQTLRPVKACKFTGSEHPTIVCNLPHGLIGVACLNPAARVESYC